MPLFTLTCEMAQVPNLEVHARAEDVDIMAPNAEPWTRCWLLLAMSLPGRSAASSEQHNVFFVTNT